MDLRVSRNPNSNIKRKMIKKKNRKKKKHSGAVELMNGLNFI